MSETELVEDVVERLGATASARAVYGEPVTEGGRTVIPVARVAYGFGGGFGAGEGAAGGSDDTTGGAGFGGVAASPVGALEITVDGTRFVQFCRPWRLLVALAAVMVAGWLLGRQWGQCRCCFRRNSNEVEPRLPTDENPGNIRILLTTKVIDERVHQLEMVGWISRSFPDHVSELSQ